MKVKETRIGAKNFTNALSAASRKFRTSVGTSIFTEIMISGLSSPCGK